MKVAESCTEKMGRVKHHPVMCREVLDLLDIRKRKIIVDCTVGVGSHAYEFLSLMRGDAHLYGVDKDRDSLKVAAERLRRFAGRYTLVHSDFAHLDAVLADLHIGRTDVLFFDLGISAYQLQSPERGFSFLKDGPLDMRMDRDSFLLAYDLVNNLSERELTLIFAKFGEERYAKRVARRLVETRRNEPVSTTNQLVQLILKAVGSKYLKQRIHPATRIFQALRIAVNRELEAQKEALRKAPFLLNKGGRVGVISFHSLEDRITKHTFRDFSSQGALKIVTKKPLIPGGKEKDDNPASRSAKLRVAERI